MDELNYLASKMEDMADYEFEQYSAIINEGNHSGTVQELINMTENLMPLRF